MEALKEILTDANIELDSQGIKIMTMDPTHTVLVHLKLEGAKFEKYACGNGNNKITIGVSMLCLFKLIKTMNNNDTLSLYIEKDDPNRLGIRIENGDKNSVTNDQNLEKNATKIALFPTFDKNSATNDQNL